MIAYKINVIGKVQGVWFRKYTRQKALTLGLNGYVENRPNHSVYIEVEGNEESILRFLKWLETGAPLSRVDKIIKHESVQVGYQSFEITR